MKTKQRILSILLTAVMVVCMLPVSVFATETTETTYSVKIFTTVADYGTTTDIGGSISGAGDYKEGDTVTLTASPNSGYCAIGWGSNNNVTLPTGSSSEYLTITFTMPAEDVEITGSFRAHTLGVFYKDLENGTHDSYCFYCGVTEGNPTAHSDLTDYTGEGDPDGWCDACGAEMHTHSYSSEWSKNASGHWYECECGEKSAFAEHTSSGAATEDAAEICTVCGYEISPKLTHQHSYGTLKYNADNHWYKCSCGDKSDVTAHSGGTATCTEKAACSVCNQSYGNLKNHTYSTEWSKDASGHWHKCSCGATSDFAGHTSSGAATEDAAEICTVCGYEISPKLTHQHNYGTLEYDAESHWYECSCGAKSGETTHTYSTEWSSDGDEHWHECSCGAIDESSRQNHEKYAPGFSEEVHWLRCLECNYYFLDPEPHTMELRHDSLFHDLSGVDGHRWECTYCAYNLDTENCTIAWEYDNTYHWGDCTECGYEKSKTAHDGEKSCATCGWSFARSAPTNLRWDTSNGTVATWDAMDGATNYIVELYKKDIITLRLLSYVVSDTSFEFDLKSLSAGSYYFTVRATFDDIKSESAASDNIMITSAGTAIVIGGVSVSVDSIDGTAYIVGREDIADASIREIDLGSSSGTASLTDKQAKDLIDEWKAYYDSFEVGGANELKEYVNPKLKDYSVDDLNVIAGKLNRAYYEENLLWQLIEEEIKSRETTALVIAPGYIDSASAFKVTTGQGLGVTYSNDALKDLLASVNTDSNVKVATKFEKAEITRDEARIIVAAWAEIVNTAEGEEQIKNLLTNYSIYELALLQQYTNILDLDEATAQKLYELMKVERDKKKEEAGTKDNEEPLAKFSVNTYAVAADGTQTYISVSKSMQYSIPVDTSSIPENATLALYRLNEDGTRTKQEILSVAADCVIAQTDGNSDYILVYEFAEDQPTAPDTSDKTVLWVVLSVVALGIMAVMATVIIKKRRTI